MTSQSAAAQRPNLFIVGAMKSGTTTLFETLRRVPKVFVPQIKEPNFFGTDLADLPQFGRTKTIHNFYGLKWVKALSEYEALYKAAPAGCRYLVDASTSYLYSRSAAENIGRYNPEAKIIILLRDPLDRARSEFSMNRAIGIETSGFDESLHDDYERLRQGKFDLFKRYVNAGLYSGQIGRFIVEFGRENVFIDVVDRPGETFSDVIHRVSDFLQLELPHLSLRENDARDPILPALNTFLYYSGIKAALSHAVPRAVIDQAKPVYYRKKGILRPRAVVSDSLKELFARDIADTERVTGFNLGHWLKNSKDLEGPRTTSIAWLSHGYGYGGNLMYFEAIFSGFEKRFPGTRIYVDKLTYAKNREKVASLRCLPFFSLKMNREVSGTPYETDIRIPSPKIIWELLVKPPELGIVIEFTPIAMLSIFFLKSVLRRKILLLIENNPHYRGAPVGTFFTKLKKYFAQKADCVMTNNQMGCDFVRQDLGVSESKIWVAPYLTSEPPAPAQTGLGMRMPAKADDQITLLFLNSITPRKGLLNLLRALLLLDRNELSRMRLLVVGDGSQLPEARAFAEQNGLGAVVWFAGRIPYECVGDVFSAADIFVSPQLADYRSLTGFEALQFGKPILMSRYDGAHTEVVEEGENGYVFDPANPESLVDRLRYLLNHPERLAVMGEKSKSRSQRYSVQSIVKNLETAVDMTVASKR